MPRGKDIDLLKESLPEAWKNVPVLSYSQLQTADRCAFLWYIKYGMRLKAKKKSERLDTGSFVHQLLHDLYNFIMDGHSQVEWVNERLPAQIMTLMDSMKFEDQITSVATASKIVERYVKSEKPGVLGGHTPVSSEEHFFVVVTPPSGRTFLLQGYIDLITVDPQGRVWIWDHKTSQKMWSLLRIKMFLQLPVYQILLQTDGMQVHGVCVNMLNTYDYKDLYAQSDSKLFRRDYNIWTPGQLTNVWNEFTALAEFALDVMEGKSPSRRSIRDDCHMCDFFGPCHANLSGEPLEESVNAFNEDFLNFRSVPAGSGVTLELD